MQLQKFIDISVIFRFLANLAMIKRDGYEQKVLSLGSDYFSATFYQTYFYYKPSKYFPFTGTHFYNLSIQSQKADK